MSTRSYIAAKSADGYQAVYCHWDGYPDYVGRVLCENYYDVDKVFQLMELGDMSCLKETISETEFYGRDRGEDDVEAAYHATLEDVAKTGRSRGAEYVYLYENHIWHVKNGTKWLPLEWNKAFHKDATSGEERCLDLD